MSIKDNFSPEILSNAVGNLFQRRVDSIHEVRTALGRVVELQDYKDARQAVSTGEAARTIVQKEVVAPAPAPQIVEEIAPAIELTPRIISSTEADQMNDLRASAERKLNEIHDPMSQPASLSPDQTDISEAA